MIMMIDDLEQWVLLSIELHRAGYKLWQMQYDIQHPEGFLVWFTAPKRPEIKFITRNDSVYHQMVIFNTQHSIPGTSTR